MACNKALSTVACSFQFTNIADEDLYLLKRNTPLEEEFFSPFLTLSIEGHPVEYEGVYASRIAPTMDEFVLLKAGESNKHYIILLMCLLSRQAIPASYI